MSCSIPKDIINVNLSYTRPTFFEQDCDRNFKKGNTDWTLILTPYKNGTINLDSGFTLSKLDMETNELYKIEEEYYIYENGIITIEGNSIFVQKAGQFSIQVECDGNVSYSANYVVEDGISNVDFKPLPPVGGEFTGEDVPLDEDRPQSVTSKIDEIQAQIDGFESVDPSEYRKSVDQDIIDQDLQNQINGINIDKANKTDLDLANQHISENTLAIINNDSRITNLENQFALLPNFEEFLTEEEDPIFNEWLSTFDFGQFVHKEAILLDDFKNLDLESGYYYTDDATLNDTSGGNISNAELIVSPTLRTWIGIDKWNGVYIRSYIIETGTWNPWRQLLSTKDIEDLEQSVIDLENDYSLSTITGGAVASVPVTPTPITFTASDLTRNNEGIEIVSPTQFSVLKSGIWEAQIKTNASKTGSGTNGTYLLGVALNGAVSKGAWQQVQVSESGSVDDASAVNRFIGYLEVGNIVSFQHYDGGDGGITLIDTTTNHPVFVTLNLLKGGDF